MDREDLIRILNSEPMKFTYAEIEQMMDEELQKDPSEMDTDFIDLCADVLCKALDAHKEQELNNNPKNNKRVKIRWAKIAIIAAIVAAILGMAATVSAKYVYNDTSDNIVKFCEDHFSINFGNKDVDTDKQADDNKDLFTKLKEIGFDNIILPTVLLENEYTYTLDVVEDDEFISAMIYFESQNDNTVIGITITKYINNINRIFYNNTELTTEYDSAKQLSLNGIEVLVFGNKDASTIIYIDNNTEYNISLVNCNFDSAIEVAESIK